LGAFASITNAKLDEASGLMALMRNIGASIGIAVVSWLLVRQGQINWQNLAQSAINRHRRHTGRPPQALHDAIAPNRPAL
jgi:hypothetical protein